MPDNSAINDSPSQWLSNSGDYHSNNHSVSGSSISWWTCPKCGVATNSYGYHYCNSYTPYIHFYTAKTCSYCKATDHLEPEACPRVKEIKYHENGTIKSIKFHG